jgi:hypothetical protein
VRKLVALVLCVLLVVTVPARAQWVVFDPTNLATALDQLAQMVQQYTQLLQMYQQIRAQYNHWVWMAQRLSPVTLARYRSLPNSWRTLSATNTYSTLDLWLSAANLGTSAAAGYRLATQPLSDFGAAAGRMPADAWSRAKTRHGQVELLDASVTQGLDVIGQLRLKAPDMLRVTKALEDDSLASGDDLNTLIAVLNKINAAGILSVRTAQNANQLLVSLLESHLADATQRREAQASALNAAVVFQLDGRRFANQFTSGTTAAILGFRLP